MIAKDRLGIFLMTAGVICIMIAYLCGAFHIKLFGYKIYYLGIAFAFPLLFSAVTTLITTHTKFSMAVCLSSIWMGITNVFIEFSNSTTGFSIDGFVYTYGGIILISCLTYQYWDSINKYWGNADN